MCPCMCFVTFEEDTLEGTGAEWLPCPCGRWLHEDCAGTVYLTMMEMSAIAHFLLICYHHHSVFDSACL